MLLKFTKDAPAPRHAAFHPITVSIEKILALKNYQSVDRHLFFAVLFSASLVSPSHLEVYHPLLFLLIMPLLFAETSTLAASKIFLVRLETFMM